MPLRNQLVPWWLKPALAAGLVLACQSLSYCQGSPSAPSAPPLAREDVWPPPPKTPSWDVPEHLEMTQADSLPPAAPAPISERAWSGPPRENPRTFWETVPPITPFPRQGNFFIMPSGPGYYTLWDFLQGREMPDRPKYPNLQWGQNSHPFFDLDYRYLDNPNNTETDWLDPLKRVHLGDDWLFSMGGEFRDRYANLDNAYGYNKKPQAGATDTFDLFRTRLYGDLWYLDRFRVFCEFIAAESSPQSVPPLSTDVDKADILNLFVELKLLDIDGTGLYVRGGRQELQFGSQRLISPSDWSNSLRTFQGVRTYYHSEDLEADAFWVQPVIVNSGKFDSVDDKQQFAGNWWKFRLNKDVSIDAYYLYLENDNQTFAGRQGLLGWLRRQHPGKPFCRPGRPGGPVLVGL